MYFLRRKRVVRMTQRRGPIEYGEIDRSDYKIHILILFIIYPQAATSSYLKGDGVNKQVLNVVNTGE